MSAEAHAEYELHLRALHELCRNDTDEGEEGEAIRDQMDVTWLRMTEEEKVRVGRLSEDLWAEYDAEKAKEKS